MRLKFSGLLLGYSIPVMTRRIWRLAAMTLLGTVFPALLPGAGHGLANPDPRIAVDVMPWGPTGSCASLSQRYLTCDSIRTSLPDTGRFRAAVVLYNVEEVTVVEYALTWPADWEIEGFTPCGTITIGGNTGENPMNVSTAWLDPQVATGTQGILVSLLSGRALSAGRISVVQPSWGSPLQVVDGAFQADSVLTTFDGGVGTTPAGDPCAFDAPVEARFWANVKTGPAPLEVSFRDRSRGAPQEWAWDFGDGGLSSERHPLHTYMACGKYTVRLWVRRDASEDAVEQSRYVVVTDPVRADSYESPRYGCAPLAVQFTDRSQGDVRSWHWQFGDGEESTERSPLHTYRRAGLFDIRLEAAGACSSATLRKTARIKVVGPPVAAGPPTGAPEGCAPMTVYFRDPTRWTADRWHWDFGDGGASDEPNPVHEYLRRENYTVTLATRNTCGESETTYVNLVRGGVAPRPAMAYLRESHEGPIRFYNCTPGVIDSVLWDFGDGQSSNAQEPRHWYQEAGVYDVSLTAFTPCGTRATVAHTMIIVQSSLPPLHEGRAVSGMVALVGNRGVDLAWSERLPATTREFHVYRRVNPLGAFSLVPGTPTMSPQGQELNAYAFPDTTAPLCCELEYQLGCVMDDASTTYIPFPSMGVRPGAGEGNSSHLAGAAPVPFNRETHVGFWFAEPMPQVTLEVFDATGRRIRTLARTGFPAGHHSVIWDATDDSGSRVAPGTYFMRFSTGAQAQTLKVVVLR